MSIRRPPCRRSFGVAARRRGRFVAMVSLSHIFKIGARQQPGIPSTMRQLTEPADGRIVMSRVLCCLLSFACLALFLSAVVVAGDDAKTTAPAKSPAEIERLIKQLGSDDFNEREAASKALEAIGEPALSALRKTAAGAGDAEVRERAEKSVKVLLQQYRQVRCFYGHTGEVHDVAFAPDGKRFLSAGHDHTIRLWEIETGKELRCLKDENDWVVCAVAFSPDGKRALSGGADQAVRMWDAKTWEEQRRFKGHRHCVFHVAFSPNGKLALSGSSDGMVRLWDIEKGEELHCFKSHTKFICCVAFSADGKRALSGCHDRTMRVWDVETGKEIRCIKNKTDGLSCVAFSPDGKQALCDADDYTLRLWDAETGKEVRRLTGHTRSVTSVAFSPDGKRALSSSVDATLRLWDIETGEELHCFKGIADSYSLAFSLDGKRALSGSTDKTVRLWQLSAEPASAKGVGGAKEK
jgi:WD40 repeat protein